MKIGVVGSGVVATTLAAGFLKHGYDVTIGSRSPEKLKDFAAQNKGVKLGTFAEAAAFGEVIVVAVKGNAAAEALRLAGTANLAGKPVIDATNPIKDAPPAKGVLQFFTDINFSLMEQLQADDVHRGEQRSRQSQGARNSGKLRLGDRGYGCSRGRSCHRAPVHAVVHPGIYEE